MTPRPIAIISGGLGGVGRAIGRHLASDGYDIVALYLDTPTDKAEAAMRELGPGRHEALECDIRDAASVIRTVERVSSSRGSLRACIHAAVDPIARKDLLAQDAETFQTQFATGVFGGFTLLTAAARIMKNGGALIGILSRPVQFTMPHPHMGGYIVAKHALRGLLKELSLECAPLHVTVNGIAPDFLNTGLNADMPLAVRAFIAERGVSGSMRSPEDVARAVSFLCSREGAGTTGKIFSLDKHEMNDL